MNEDAWPQRCVDCGLLVTADESHAHHLHCRI